MGDRYSVGLWMKKRFEDMTMSEQMVHLRKEADDAESDTNLPVYRYDHKSDGIMDDHSGGMSNPYGEISLDPWDKHQEQKVVHELNSMSIKRENERLTADNTRHIKEKNQLGSKNNILKKKAEALEIENAELKYKLSSFLKENTDIKVRKKLIGAIKKQS